MERNPVIIEAFDDEIEKSGMKKLPLLNSSSSLKPTEIRSSPSSINTGSSGTSGDPSAMKMAPRGRPKKSPKEEHHFPVQPKIIQVVKKPRTIVNHSYMDFSCVPPELNEGLNDAPTAQKSFPEKVYEILSKDAYKGYICWMPHGRAFKVRIPKRFEEKVCPKYFGHSRYSSFLRMLNNYGFKHITMGPDRNSYYHQCFLKGLPHLLKYTPKPKNARRLVPDPQNEPNFYKIAEEFPLPGQENSSTESSSAAAAKPTPVSFSSSVAFAPVEQQQSQTSHNDADQKPAARKPLAPAELETKQAPKRVCLSQDVQQPAAKTQQAVAPSFSAVASSTLAAALLKERQAAASAAQAERERTLQQLANKALLSHAAAAAVASNPLQQLLRQRQALAQSAAAAAIQERNNNQALIAAALANHQSRVNASNAAALLQHNSSMPNARMLSALENLQRFS